MSLKSVLSAVAPVLASALPGPLGGLARKLIGETLGKPGASESEIEKLLAASTPETLLKLKQVEAEFQEKMKQLDIDLEKMVADDRANARAREVALKDKTPRVLAGAIIGGYLLLQLFVLRGTIPTANHDIVVRSLSILEAAVVLVLGYYFGSSAGSARKDTTISSLSQ